MSESETPNFEAALEQLESLVHALEEGDLSLEASLKTFEQGIQLTRQCQDALKSAEQRVSVLMEKDGLVEEEEFDASDLE